MKTDKDFEILFKKLRKLYPYGAIGFINMSLEEMALHSAKNRDYAYEGDPLGNFKRVAGMLSLYGIAPKPEIVALMYMLKQVDAIMNMLLKGYEGEVEGLDDKLKDISIYAKLVRLLVRNTIKG